MGGGIQPNFCCSIALVIFSQYEERAIVLNAPFLPGIFFFRGRRVLQVVADGSSEIFIPGLRNDLTVAEHENRALGQPEEHQTTDFRHFFCPARNRVDRRIPTGSEISQVGSLSTPQSSLIDDDHTARALTVMDPVFPGVAGEHPPHTLSGSEPVDNPVGGILSTNGRPSPSGNRLEAIGSCLDSQGFPPEVVELLLSATRENTNTAYQSAWNGWNNWCHARNIDPMSGGVKEVLCYLAEFFKTGVSYSTVNISRSMLSSTLNLMGSDHRDIGRHPLVAQLMKGIYHAKPPTPKYSSTWDPAVVLSHFSATAGRTLSLLQQARKVVTLLALTTLLRCSEITSIQTETIEFSGSKVSFGLGALRKSQRSGPLKRYSLSEWTQNRALCPLTCLRTYLERTRSLRSSHNGKQLFIGSTKPHNPVTSSTVGRWIKEQLKEAGIDTSVFSAHSTRGAAASKAASSGVSIQSILKQGHWANESTFSKFYRRETASERDRFESTILADEMSDSD